MNEERTIRVEEVDSVAPPPKARVEDAEPAPETMGDKLERKRDYLEGFLAAKPAATDPHGVGGDLYEAVIDALKEIYDPEIPVNIYDLGLLYNVEIDEGHVLITMTLTTPHCPVAESIPGAVELRAGVVPGAGDAEVNLVGDPPGTPANISDEARLELGML